MDRLDLSVNILVNWYKNSGTDPLGSKAWTIDEGGNEQLRVDVDVEDDEDGLVRLPRFAKANDG